MNSDSKNVPESTYKKVLSLLLCGPKSDQPVVADAIALLEAAASAGYAPAQAHLSYLYDNGDLFLADEEKAFYWYGMAAAQGNAFAQNNFSY